MANEDVVIVPYRDGPYLVRGPLVLRDQDGRTIDLSRRTVALCRCGKSRMRPFCDGTHRLVEFRAPSHAESPWATPAERRGEAVAARPGRDRATAADGGGGSAALAGLRRVRVRVAALLDVPSPERGQLAVRAALPLIDGACRLLESPPQPAARSELAALHLVKGAFDALGEAADVPEGGMAAAAADLAAVAVALEPRCNGSWRSQGL
jgi:CDGSH-type Zn-finger protein